MDPESELFQYPRFRNAGPNFRLLRLGEERYGDIKCELIEAVLGDTETMPYVALSYCWGSSTKDKFISIGKSKLPVTSSLFTMLDSLRIAEHRDLLYDSGYLWIDAICIDQSHEQEKAHQIDWMKEIYHNAESVIIWLGKATDDSDLVMKALTDLKNETKNHAWKPDDLRCTDAWERVKASRLYPGDLRKLSQGLTTLLSRDWFRRVWVLQEASNAKSAFISCGSKMISTRYFTLSPPLMRVYPSSHCQAVLGLMPGSIKDEVEELDLYSLLLRFRAAEATEQKDRIFALLGLYSEDTGYTSLKDLYSRDTYHIIRAIISHICFHDADSLPKKLYMHGSIDIFLGGLHMLDTMLFSQLVHSEVKDLPSIDRFLAKRQQYIRISERTVEDLLQHPSHAGELMDLALKHLRKDIAITEERLITIAKNESQGRSLMAALEQNCREKIKLTNAVIVALFMNQATGLQILKVLTPRLEEELEINGEVALALWTNVPNGRDIIKSLYNTFTVQLQFDAAELERIKYTPRSKDLSALLATCTTDTSRFFSLFRFFKAALDAGHILITNNHYPIRYTLRTEHPLSRYRSSPWYERALRWP